MKISVLLALLASTAFGQGYSSISSPSSIAAGGGVTLATAQTITGAKTFSAALLTTASLRTTQGQKLTFDGATEAKYLSSDGTTLTLTGLNFSPAAGKKLCLGPQCLTYFDTPDGATNVTINTNGWAFITSAQLIAGAGVSAFTGNPSLTNNSSTPLRITTGNALLLASSSGGLCIGNGTGDECDGELKTAGLTVGTSGTKIDDSYAASSTIDFASTTNTTADSANITVTGAAVGDGCVVGVPVAAQVAGASFTCFVTAADTVVVRLSALGAGIDPTSGSFTVRVFDP